MEAAEVVDGPEAEAAAAAVDGPVVEEEVEVGRKEGQHIFYYQLRLKPEAEVKDGPAEVDGPADMRSLVNLMVVLLVDVIVVLMVPLLNL